MFTNISNNTAPFVSITWHQKEPLGCVVYSHCPTNDSYNICIHSCCLPCNYVTKLFGILQRVIKRQSMCISFGNSKSWYHFSQKGLWLNLDILLLNIKVLWKGNYLKRIRPYQCVVSRKKSFFFVHVWECPYTFNCTWKFSHALPDGLLPNINSLISKQNKTPKIDPKMLKQ